MFEKLNNTELADSGSEQTTANTNNPLWAEKVEAFSKAINEIKGVQNYTGTFGSVSILVEIVVSHAAFSGDPDPEAYLGPAFTHLFSESHWPVLSIEGQTVMYTGHRVNAFTPNFLMNFFSCESKSRTPTSTTFCGSIFGLNPNMSYKSAAL